MSICRTTAKSPRLRTSLRSTSNLRNEAPNKRSFGNFTRVFSLRLLEVVAIHASVELNSEMVVLSLFNLFGTT